MVLVTRMALGKHLRQNAEPDGYFQAIPTKSSPARSGQAP